jgi:peptide/nickel transport system permease protein
MTSYLIKRIVDMFGVLLVVAIVVFSIIHLTPGDPARVMAGDIATEAEVARIREALGLNQPLHIQFVNWSLNLLRGDLGNSLYLERPVLTAIVERAEPTIILTILSMILAITVGVITGVISAARHNTFTDQLLSVIALVGVSIPNFWLGLILILVFAVNLGWFPSSGYSTIAEGGLWQSLRYLFLPAFALGLSQAALISRITRSSMLDVFRQDFVRTAFAKGLARYAVVYFHVLRNALIPIVTVVGIVLAVLLSGAIIVEVVFAIPGLGRLTIASIARRDYPVIQGVVLVVTVIYVLINLIVDLLYTVIDPRVKY